MKKLDDFLLGNKKEEINPTQKYPVIWKTTKCLMGECRSERTSHRWAIAATYPNGLATECYDCHKIRDVISESDSDIWINKLK
jgi:hypothetical protein